jgi:hypothetical protein
MEEHNQKEQRALFQKFEEAKAEMEKQVEEAYQEQLQRMEAEHQEQLEKDKVVIRTQCL